MPRTPPPPPPPSTSQDIDDKIRKRLFIVENYWFYRASCNAVRTAWRKFFPRSEAPTNRLIQAQVPRFHNFGSVEDQRKGHAGRKSSVTPDMIEEVENFFSENPSCSTRRASSALEISRSTLQRILKKDLKLFPYKIQMFQELSENDASRRLEFANRALRYIEDEVETLKRVVGGFERRLATIIDQNGMHVERFHL